MARMLARQRLGPRALAQHDRLDDRVMLFMGEHQPVASTGAGAVDHHEAVGRCEGQRHRALDLALHHGRAARLGQQGMEAQVVPGIGRERGGADLGRCEQGVDLAEAFAHLGQHRGVGTALGRQTRGQAFERAAQLDGVLDVALGELAHHVAAAGQGLDQALLLQAHEGGADRRARHRQPIDHREFGDALAGREFAADDHLAQRQLRP